jgi:hypothetical protein
MKKTEHFMLYKTTLLIICGMLIVSGTLFSENASHMGATEPSINAIDGLDAEEALAIANRWHEAGSDVVSFVDQRNIYFMFNNGEEAVVPLPENSMVVAIAPYLTYTHECTLHYTSACQSEMTNTPLKVYGRTESGMVVVDSTITTLSNGFIELWLPRNEKIELTIEASGKRGSEIITTYDTSRTCITTLQLL